MIKNVNSKFTALGLAATATIMLSGCSGEMTQKELQEYCGIDTNKMITDLNKEGQKIENITISGEDCQMNFKYSDGNNQQVSSSDVTGMLLAGGIGMMAGYLAADAMSKSSYRSEIAKERKRRASGGGAVTSSYINSNSRSYGAFTSGRSTSGINVSGGKVTTRSSSFSGAKAGGARGGSYGG